MIYLDTSALIKRFVEEKEKVPRLSNRWWGPVKPSPPPKSLMPKCSPVLRAKCAKVISPRFSTISRAANLKLTGKHTFVSSINDDLLFLARDLIRRHGLKGFDAVHLASALVLNGAIDEEVTFAAADRRLLRNKNKICHD